LELVGAAVAVEGILQPRRRMRLSGVGLAAAATDDDVVLAVPVVASRR